MTQPSTWMRCSAYSSEWTLPVSLAEGEERRRWMLSMALEREGAAA